MPKSERKTLSRALNAAVTVISLALMAAFMAQSGIFNGPCTEKAFAETASSHSIAKKVGKIAQYDEGAYVHDFMEGVLGVNGEVAFCMDPNIDFKSGTVSSADILSVVSSQQLTDIALRAHFVRDVYQDSYLSENARVILAQTLVWEVLSPNQRFVVVAAEDGGDFPEVTAAVREDACAKARAFANANASRYESHGTLWVNGSTQPVATFGCQLAVGDIDLAKRSSNPSVSDGNANYALEGAMYGIYADSACTGVAARITTNANGYAKSGELQKGTYYVREIAAPKGFELDKGIYPVVVAAGQTTHVNGGALYDAPLIREGLASLAKHDAEIGWHPDLGGALGSATVVGARYSVAHYGDSFANADEACASGNPLAVWEFSTDADGRIDLARPDDYLESGTLYRDSSDKAIFPLGTYVIRESAPSDGYLLSPEAFVVKVEQDGSGSTIKGGFREGADGKTIAAAEQVKRGDLALVKVRETDMTRLANIPFMLVSETTGETHVLLTDENGRLDTAASWNPHTARTNANDNALNEDGSVDESKLDATAGSWFGQTPVGEMTQANDSLGALPFDTYTLVELPCASNAGLVLVRMEGIQVTRDSVTVDLGTIDDKEAQLPAIATVAYDAVDRDKQVSAEPNAVIKDEVELTGLVPGRTYTLYGTVIDVETGLPVLAGRGTDEAAGEMRDGQPENTQKEDVQAFWDGLVELLGAKRVPSIEGYSYEIGSDQRADGETIQEHLAQHESISSRMVMVSREFEAESPTMVTALDYEMDASELEGDYVIYDLLVADDGAMAVHADTANEQESFTVDRPTTEAPGKGYYKTGSLFDALGGTVGASGMVAAGTMAGAGLFIGRRRFGGWMHG